MQYKQFKKPHYIRSLTYILSVVLNDHPLTKCVVKSIFPKMHLSQPFFLYDGFVYCSLKNYCDVYREEKAFFFTPCNGNLISPHFLKVAQKIRGLLHSSFFRKHLFSFFVLPSKSSESLSLPAKMINVSKDQFRTKKGGKFQSNIISNQKFFSDLYQWANSTGFAPNQVQGSRIEFEFYFK